MGPSLGRTHPSLGAALAVVVRVERHLHPRPPARTHARTGNLEGNEFECRAVRMNYGEGDVRGEGPQAQTLQLSGSASHHLPAPSRPSPCWSAVVWAMSAERKSRGGLLALVAMSQEPPLWAVSVNLQW